MSPDRVKSTRKQDGQDEPMALTAAHKTMQIIDTTVRPYWRQISIAAGVIVAVIIISSVVLASRTSRIARGFAALQQAEETQELIDVADEFAGTLPGSQASLAAARKLYEEGKYDQAVSRFALVGQDYAGSPFAEAAQFGEAYSLEALEKFQEAQKRFDSLADETDDPTRIVDACLGGARCAKALGKYAEAEKRIQKAIDSGVEGMLEFRAKEALKALKSAQLERPEPKQPATEVAPEAAEAPTEETAETAVEKQAEVPATEKAKPAETK